MVINSHFSIRSCYITLLKIASPYFLRKKYSGLFHTDIFSFLQLRKLFSAIKYLRSSCTKWKSTIIPFSIVVGKKGVYSISLKEVVGFFIVGAMQSIKLAECSSHKDVSDEMRFEKALNLTDGFL